MKIATGLTLSGWLLGKYYIDISLNDTVDRENQNMFIEISTGMSSGTGPGVLLDWEWSITFSYNGIEYTKSGSNDNHDFLSGGKLNISGFSIPITDSNRNSSFTINITQFSLSLSKGIYSGSYSRSTAFDVTDSPRESISLSYITRSSSPIGDEYILETVSTIPTHPIQVKGEIQGAGYFCSGWQDESGINYKSGTSIYVDDNLRKLFASVYNPIHYNVVLYNEYTDKTANETYFWKEIAYNSEEVLPAIRDTGFMISADSHFIGWSLTSGATNIDFIDQGTIKNLSSTDGDTVYIYTVVTSNSYTISYNLNYVPTINYYINDTIANYSDNIDLPVPLRETSYTFKGWKTIEDPKMYLSGGTKSVIMSCKDINNQSGILTYTRYDDPYSAATCALIVLKSPDTQEVLGCYPLLIDNYKSSSNVKFYYGYTSYTSYKTYKDDLGNRWFYSKFDENAIAIDPEASFDSKDLSGLNRINLSKLTQKIYDASDNGILEAAKDLINIYYNGFIISQVSNYFQDLSLIAQWDITKNKFIKLNNEWKPCIVYRKINGSWKKLYPYRKNSEKWYDFGIQFVVRYSCDNTVFYKMISPSDIYYRRFAFISGLDYVGCTTMLNGSSTEVPINYVINKDTSLTFRYANINVTNDFVKNSESYNMNVYYNNEKSLTSLTKLNNSYTNIDSGSIYISLKINNEVVAMATLEDSGITNIKTATGDYYPILLDGTKRYFDNSLNQYIAELRIVFSSITINQGTEIEIQSYTNNTTTSYKSQVVFQSEYINNSSSSQIDTVVSANSDIVASPVFNTVNDFTTNTKYQILLAYGDIFTY